MNALLQGAGSRYRILAAPSGSGKTTAAAMYAKDSGSKVLWVEARGMPLRQEQLLVEMLAWLRGDDSIRLMNHELCQRTLADLEYACLNALRVASAESHEQFLIVVDDVCSTDSDVVLALSRLHVRVEPLGVQFLVTTRNDALSGHEMFRDALVIGETALAVTWPECMDMAAAAGCAMDDALQVYEATRQNIALMRLMLEEGPGAPRMGAQDSRVFAALGRLLSINPASGHRDYLWLMGLLQYGNDEDLGRIGACAGDALARLSTVPLLGICRMADRPNRFEFKVHDLAAQWILDACSVDVESSRTLAGHAVEILSQRGDLQRAAHLIVHFPSTALAEDWLRKHGDSAIGAGQHLLVLDVVRLVGLQLMMDSPQLLAQWADALLRSGDHADALAKSKAALGLAEYSSDERTSLRSLICMIEAYKRLGQYSEAGQAAERLVAMLGPFTNVEQRVEGCVEAAKLQCVLGDLRKATDAIEIACELSLGQSLEPRLRGIVAEYRAVVRAIRFGCNSEESRQLAAALPLLDAWHSERAVARGNLALMLIEAGRLGRAKPLVRAISMVDDDYFKSAFIMLEVMIAAADGLHDLSRSLMHDVVDSCVRGGFEYDLAGNRIYLSTILRAAGQHEEALSQAERAFERLAITDYMGYRRLAVIEIAASLLAMNDVAAARKWVGVASSGGVTENAYHALRADMVLAECDRREGDETAAVARLAENREHIISESSNWQVAMFCRAFPGLLGLITQAVTPEAMPSHMLRMISGGEAESCMRACKDVLSAEDWVSLGRRLMGDAEFARFQARKGAPICRVRLLGGLDVSVDDRRIAEQDWGKRKARLLFAMLVAKRGSDVPRDQVLEYLWPDLPEVKARNNFYVVWSAIKLALTGESSRSVKCPYFDSKGGRLRVIAGALRSDLDDFEEILDEARSAATDHDVARAVDAYSRLSMLYRGDLLPGDVYDDWFASLRDHYRFEFVDAMLEAAELLLDAGDPCEALGFARRALGVDGLREDLYQLALRCHIATGQRSGAIDTFIQCKSRLADDLGLDPSAETMSLYQEILVMEDAPRYVE